MSNAVDSPVVVLFEDRPKQGMIFQLNLSIYIDARVKKAESLKDLKKFLADPDGVQLVVARAQFMGKPIVGKIMDLLTQNGLSIPVISLGDEKERPGLTIVGGDNEVKPLLQNAAKILGITAKSMVSKERPDKFDISADFMNLLFTVPCDVYDRGPKGIEKVFSTGDVVSRKKIAAYMEKKASLVIDSLQRLKLVNAVTEQSQKASEDLTAEPSLPDEKKMSILSASLDMVAAQFQNAGMDEETVKLANASIKAVEKIAESATSVGNLVKQLMAAEGGYRYAHCQLLTFLGFHVIKMMGWWGDDQRAILSQASFYHDISLKTDEEARVRSMKQLAATSFKDPQSEERVLTHPQLAARELQSAPEISPEVVRVVIQHHGSSIGKGFSTDVAKLDNLTKTFLLAEEWADYLIHLSDSNGTPDNEGKIKELKAMFNDDLCRQIAETFRYLDPEEFSNDFMSTKEVDFAASLISGGSAGSEAVSVVIPIKREEEPETKVSGVTDSIDEGSVKVKGWSEEEEQALVKLRGAADEKSKELLAKFEAKKKRVLEEQKVSGGASSGDSAKKVKGWSEEEEQALVKLRGATDEKSKELLSKFEAKKKRVLEEQRVSGEASAEDSAKKVKGWTDEEEQALVKLRGATDEKSKELLSKFEAKKQKLLEEQRFSGDGDGGGGTLVKGGPAEALARAKVSGVTEHINDEVHVIKGDKSQNYVDNSITRIKADPQEKERELKMKALAGSSELMKSALGGQMDKVLELLKENVQVELRKTDAEGRTAIHYAAMGGSVSVLKFLLEKGAQMNTVDSKRRSALFLAALYKQNDAFDFLLTQGAKISQQAMGGMTIAMIGAFSGNMHILKTAVEKGVKLDVKDHAGKTALDLAKQGKHTEAVTYIEAAMAQKAPAAKASAAKGATA